MDGENPVNSRMLLRGGVVADGVGTTVQPADVLIEGPVITAVQHLVPRRMRSTASASFLLINNLIGLGIGPYLIGAISTALKSNYGSEALRYAAVGCTVFYLIAALLMLLCVGKLRAAWVDDRSH